MNLNKAVRGAAGQLEPAHICLIPTPKYWPVSMGWCTFFSGDNLPLASRIRKTLPLTILLPNYRLVCLGVTVTGDVFVEVKVREMESMRPCLDRPPN